MIKEFLDSWDLFQNAYLSGWLIGVALSLVGVLVVARDQIFIGAAITQASTLGIAVSLWLQTTLGPSLPWLAGDETAPVLAVVFSILAALLTSRGGSGGRESHEAITGWVFLACASLALLVVANSPHGLEEIQRLLSSSLIGATSSDVWAFGILAAVTAGFVACFRQRLLLFALDPEMAGAVGMRVGLWSTGSAIWLGLLVGFSIHVSGMLYTFGTLVLPALIAKNLCREVGPLFLVAPLVAAGAGVTGFVLANHYDFAQAQMTVALLAGLLALAWGIRWLRRRASPPTTTPERRAA